MSINTIVFTVQTFIIVVFDSLPLHWIYVYVKFSRYIQRQKILQSDRIIKDAKRVKAEPDIKIFYYEQIMKALNSVTGSSSCVLAIRWRYERVSCGSWERVTSTFSRRRVLSRNSSCLYRSGEARGAYRSTLEFEFKVAHLVSEAAPRAARTRAIPCNPSLYVAGSPYASHRRTFSQNLPFFLRLFGSTNIFLV